MHQPGTTRRALLHGAAALLATGCSPRPGKSPAAFPGTGEVKTGGARMIDVDGKYRVWTKRVGNGAVKVLTLHGGPGGTHFSFECFEDFLPQAGIEFFYYDQLGCGFSDQPNDTSLWTLGRFIEEVEQVRRGLGLDRFVLYGHSWGGLLGIEYALKYGRYLSKLVISNMAASIASYEARAAKLRATIPEAARREMEDFEKAGKYEDPRYQALMTEHLYSKYICRLKPWPDPVERAFRYLAQPVYGTMQGPNEFVVTGNLKGWDRWAGLPRIAVPTLTIGSRYDEMDPADMEKMARLLPQGEYAYCPQGSHLCMWDDQPAYFDHLLRFVRS